MQNELVDSQKENTLVFNLDCPHGYCDNRKWPVQQNFLKYHIIISLNALYCLVLIWPIYTSEPMSVKKKW